MSKAHQYAIISPDGISIHPEPYNTLDEVAQAAAAFMMRYVHQGYYRDTRMREIPLCDLPSLLRVEVIDAKMTPTQAYIQYIQDNLERIGRDGWVPVCYEEFLESEECDNYLSVDYDEAPLPTPITADNQHEWVQAGVVGVDAGMLMVGDPCYLLSEWKGEGSKGRPPAPTFRHKDGRILYCALHGGQPTPDAIPFGSFEMKMPQFDGKTPNEMNLAGEMTEIKKDPSGEFSYAGCCEATLSDEQFGQLNYTLGHAGAGVVFSSGYGDGVYPVYLRFYEDENWGRRVAEARIVMIPDEEEEEDDDEPPTCILTGADGEDPDDCTTHDHEVPTVNCKFCRGDVPASTAHLHQGGWVGDECCWDERLRSTE